MSYKAPETYGIDSNPHEEGPESRLVGSDKLIGSDVFNHRNEELGDITEIMVDVNTGKIVYAVLSFGGFLGMADKLFAVPWSALELHNENKRFLLDIEKAPLETAPGFNKDNWPDMAEPNWKQTITSKYGTKPFLETTSLDDTSTYIDKNLL